MLLFQPTPTCLGLKALLLLQSNTLLFHSLTDNADGFLPNRKQGGLLDLVHHELEQRNHFVLEEGTEATQNIQLNKAEIKTKQKLRAKNGKNKEQKNKN